MNLLLWWIFEQPQSAAIRKLRSSSLICTVLNDDSSMGDIEDELSDLRECRFEG